MFWCRLHHSSHTIWRQNIIQYIEFSNCSFTILSSWLKGKQSKQDEIWQVDCSVFCSQKCKIYKSTSDKQEMQKCNKDSKPLIEMVFLTKFNKSFGYIYQNSQSKIFQNRQRLVNTHNKWKNMKSKWHILIFIQNFTLLNYTACIIL